MARTRTSPGPTGPRRARHLAVLTALAAIEPRDQPQRRVERRRDHAKLDQPFDLTIISRDRLAKQPRRRLRRVDVPPRRRPSRPFNSSRQRPQLRFDLLRDSLEIRAHELLPRNPLRLGAQLRARAQQHLQYAGKGKR